MDRSGLKQWVAEMENRRLQLPRLRESIAELSVHLAGMKYESPLAVKKLAELWRQYWNEYDSIIDDLGTHLEERIKFYDDQRSKDQRASYGPTEISWNQEGM